jgi:very-short-patch-repair endonuclease
MAVADGPDCHEPHRDAAMMAIAARQHGLVTTAQLVEAGIRRGAIARRVQSGRLKPWCRGVYLAAPAALPWTAEMAALLTCGVERSGLSRLTAVAVYGLRTKPSIVDIDVDGNVRSRKGIRVHRTTNLEVTVHKGLRVTTLTRTLEDLAPRLETRELDRLVQEAHAQNLTLLPSRRLRTLDHEEITRSEGERRLHALIAKACLPRAKRNARVGHYEVDALWPEHRLIVEVDGYAFHSSRPAFERDRAKDAHLTAMGYRVIRVTWRQLTHAPEVVIARLAAALAPTP